MWKTSIIVVPIVVAVLVVTGDWWASLIAGIVFTTVILALKAGIVVVPTRKAAVVFNRLKFYTGLRGPGLGFIFPFWEHVEFYLDLRPKIAQMTIRDIHTCDQVPVAISLSLFYRLNPWEMRPALRPHLIDLLELSAVPILQRQVEHLLRRLVGLQGIATLLQPDVRAYLEDCLANELPRHVGWLGVDISGRVMLGNIALPETVQAEINLAHQTQIHVRARAYTLNELREVLNAQPDRAWEKVIEVEAVDALGRNGAPVLFPYSTVWRAGAFRSRADGES
jgi:regulator of protease activity HflC (stomatin/prohibitin superfamily)